MPILEGMEPTRLLKLKSIKVREEQSPMSTGIVPVRLASEITSLFRKGNEERFEGIGSSRGIDCILISVTKDNEEHVMEVQLHGLASRIFQLEKEGGGGDFEL